MADEEEAPEVGEEATEVPAETEAIDEAPPAEAPPAEAPPDEAPPAEVPPAEAAPAEAAPAEAEAAAPATPGGAGADAPPPQGPSAAEGPAPQSTAQRVTQDPLNTEFLYYSAVLRILGPTLTREDDRNVIIPWIRKLFRPEYHSSKLREKRNRYLAYLSTSLLLDDAIGVFRCYPPDGALVDCDAIIPPKVEAAEWEVDKMWQDTLTGLSEEFQMLECCVHASEEECRADHRLDKILDREFQLFLYIARPYAFLIRIGNDRTRIAAWLQMLCSIQGKDSCSSMKAIRNDYMMALLGYLQDLRSVGPFADLPSWKTLIPLAEAAKNAAENKPIIDPSGSEANEFMMNQPMPDDGAFCYIALNGDLVSSNLLPN